MKASKITLDFETNTLSIPDEEIRQVDSKEGKKVEIDLTRTGLLENQQQQLQQLFRKYAELFSDQPGLTHVLYHEIVTGDQPLVASRPYRYDRVKESIIELHIQRMLEEGTIMPIQSPYASPVVLCRKKNDKPVDSPDAYRFAIDYRKLNAITRYPKYPLPIIDDLLMNIQQNCTMSTLDTSSLGIFSWLSIPRTYLSWRLSQKKGRTPSKGCRSDYQGVHPRFSERWTSY
ncbi:retrovirus-related Pol polyprotein from transposon 17.6 [Nephila pilipes]|uniref:Retrovirus-related Pol polyprotein from transposon 17.6 n=1 Tax=Nephila pilipes TaxID=299642 RepID=A0A8X6QY45_NEPPI|nr:retrovirus-related Pol polyprotein from transposon 17.6 [Nephila pilipes]